MRFEKNKNIFLKMCCVCDKQFTIESEWTTHRSVCRGGGKSLNFAKKVDVNANKETSLKKFDTDVNTGNISTLDNKEKFNDTDNEFADLDKATKENTLDKDVEIVKEKTESLEVAELEVTTPEVIEEKQEEIVIEETIEDVKQEDVKLEELIEENVITDIEEVVETDLTEVLPIEEVKIPIKRGRAMKKNKSKSKAKKKD